MKILKAIGELIAWIVGYILVILAGIAVIIALGYLLGCLISVHEEGATASGGVCTSTLCQ